ncbi:MAG: hypothetical protein JST68_10355 [Bacteroidetes bacterium]|nr:hypothetical protein [Bacteroidota bacterium]
MILRFYLTAIIVFLISSGRAQDITPKEADSVQAELNKPIKDKDRITDLLQLASFNVHLRRISDTMLKASNDYLHEAEQLNKKTRYPFFTEQSLIVQAALYKAQGNIQAGKATLEKVITLSKSSNNQALLGKAYYEMSLYYTSDFFHETMLERIKYLQLAITAFEQTNHFFELARCYRFLADLHQLVNDNRSAFAEVKSALKYYDQAGIKDKQGAVSLLGRLYYEEGDYRQALQNELLALKIATNSSSDNVNLICQINNNIGYTYIKLKEPEKALQFFSQALDIAKQDKDTPTVYLLSANVVDAYLAMNAPQKAVRFFHDITRQYTQPASMKYEGGDFGISHTYLKIYMALGEYDRARFYCDRLIQQASNPNINLYTLSLYYQLIANYYIKTASYEKAQTYLKKDRDLVDSLKSFSGIAQNYKLQFSLDSASGKYQEAITDLIKQNDAKDSIFDATKSKQIANLEIEFETEKKQNQITLLNQKAMLEESRAKQANIIRNVTIGVIALLLIIAILLYRQSNLRKMYNITANQKNELLENLVKEKAWLVKEIHHRVKNNLQIVISLLNAQAQYADNSASMDALMESRERMHTIAIIHQMLYQQEEKTTIQMEDYVNNMISSLQQSLTNADRIYFYSDVDPIALDISQVVPLGLIINEAVTNAVKYAFCDKHPGAISITLKYAETGRILLSIADNGRGLPAGFDIGKSRTLGIQLIKMFADQLEGQLSFISQSGLELRLTFREDKPENFL